MATKSMDLGQVMGTSAYQEAQAGGYTGTKEEFQKELAAIANKAETFVVTFSGIGSGSSDDITTDHTAAEIIQATNAGKIVIAKYAISFGEEPVFAYLPLALSAYNADAPVVLFSTSGDGASITMVLIEGNTAKFIQKEIAPLETSVVPKAPGTAAVGTSDNCARADHVHPKEVSDDDRTAWNGKASKPTVTTVTLTAASWDTTTKKQTVTVPGVLADTSKQVIWVTQTTEAAIDAYLDAGIVPVAQAANAVTLRADTVPTADITVNIVVQEVQ
nr:MAG TPA: hypothetical protein [Caudoviricetes sp.]